jgi:anion-transporting  ArsA/GET3 family ATPase
MRTIQPRHSLVIVTGKGGIGKSALATSIARLSAQAGLRTVLVTLDTRAARHPFLSTELQYVPVPVAERLHLSRVDAFEAMVDYARARMPMAGLYGSFFRSRAFRDFAAAAPGFDELMCLGRLYNLAVERDFDRVVFDAPATGHLRTLLGVPAAVRRAVQVGPVYHVAGRIQDLLLDTDRTHVLIGTLAEELPVQEALELLSLCRDELRMSVGPVLVNRCVTARVSQTELGDLVAACRLVPAVSSDLRAAIELVEREIALVDSQFAALAPFREAGVTMLEIPRVALPMFDSQGLLAELDRALAGVVEPL